MRFANKSGHRGVLVVAAGPPDDSAATRPLQFRGSQQMSVRSNRVHALAAATALVLASTVAGSAFAAERVNLSGLQTAAKFDRFIVKFSDGSVERRSAASVQSALSTAATASAGKVKGKAALGLK